MLKLYIFYFFFPVLGYLFIHFVALRILRFPFPIDDSEVVNDEGHNNSSKDSNCS